MGDEVVTEFRILASDGWVDDGYNDAEHARDFAESYDRASISPGQTHRVQSRTVTTTEWKDVPDV